MKNSVHNLLIKSVWIFFLILSFLIFTEFGLRITGFTVTSDQRMNNAWKEGYNNDIRILAIGESTTACGGKNSWPDQLESFLNNHSDKRFVVFNGGVGGTRTSFILSRIKSLLNKYHPDIVISMMGINDEIFGINTVYKERFTDKFKLFFQDLRTYKLGFYLYSYFKSNSKNPITEQIPLQLEKNIKKCNNILNGGDHKNAEKCFLKAVKQFPNSSESHFWLGYFYWNEGKLNKSFEMFKMAFKLTNHPSSMLYNAMGDVYTNSGKYKLAKAMYEKSEETKEMDWTFTSIEKIMMLQNESDSKIRKFYRKWGFDFSINQQMSNYNITKYHYNELYKILSKKNITLIAMQYPLRDVNDLKKMLNYNPNIVFVSNKENFEEALKRYKISNIFIDLFGGQFGHATPLGNKLIAENVGNVILNITSKK